MSILWRDPKEQPPIRSRAANPETCTTFIR